MFSRFIHIAANDSISLFGMAEKYSIMYFINIHIYAYIYVYKCK